MTSVQQPHTPTDFPLFQELPVELQVMVYEHWCEESSTLAQIRYRQTDDGKLRPIPQTTNFNGDDAPFPPAKVMPELYALLPAGLSKKLGEAHRRSGTVQLHVTLYPGNPEPLEAFSLQAAGQSQHVPSPNLVRGITFCFDPTYMRSISNIIDQHDKWVSAINDAKAIMKQYPKLGGVEFRFCVSGSGTKELGRLASGNAKGLRLIVEESLAYLPSAPGVLTRGLRRRPKETWPETLKVFVHPYDEHAEILKCWKGKLVTVNEYMENVQRAEQEREEQKRKQAADLARRKEILELTRSSMEERRQRELAMCPTSSE